MSCSKLRLGNLVKQKMLTHVRFLWMSDVSSIFSNHSLFLTPCPYRSICIDTFPPIVTQSHTHVLIRVPISLSPNVRFLTWHCTYAGVSIYILQLYSYMYITGTVMYRFSYYSLYCIWDIATLVLLSPMFAHVLTLYGARKKRTQTVIKKKVALKKKGRRNNL